VSATHEYLMTILHLGSTSRKDLKIDAQSGEGLRISSLY